MSIHSSSLVIKKKTKIFFCVCVKSFSFFLKKFGGGDGSRGGSGGGELVKIIEFYFIFSLKRIWGLVVGSPGQGVVGRWKWRGGECFSKFFVKSLGVGIDGRGQGGSRGMRGGGEKIIFFYFLKMKFGGGEKNLLFEFFYFFF